MRKLLSVFMILVLVTSAVLAEEANNEVVTLEDLIGIWELADMGIYMDGQTNPDGSLKILYYPYVDDDSQNKKQFHAKYGNYDKEYEIRMIREFFDDGTGEYRIEHYIDGEIVDLDEKNKTWQVAESPSEIETFKWSISGDYLYITITNSVILEKGIYYSFTNKNEFSYQIKSIIESDHTTGYNDITKLFLIGEGKYIKKE